MSDKNNIPNFGRIANELLKNASRYAASEAVTFFKESFTKSGFTDSSFNKWEQTTNSLSGKHTMYRSGTLMRSIRKQTVNTKKVVVISDTDYSEIHNSGGTITVTDKMKKFWWAKYYEFAGKVTTNKKGAVSLNKKNTGLGAKAIFCRRMAMMRVGSKIKIKKRQFMGESAVLMKNFDTWFGKEVIHQVEQSNNKTVNIELGTI